MATDLLSKYSNIRAVADNCARMTYEGLVDSIGHELARAAALSDHERVLSSGYNRIPLQHSASPHSLSQSRSDPILGSSVNPDKRWDEICARVKC